MCRFKTSWSDFKLYIPEMDSILKRLREMEQDGIVEITKGSLLITEKGRPFVRNVCMAFDLPLQKKSPDTKLFSMTV